MPVHDWTRVDDGTFHDFHSSWITHLKESLNRGVLPRGYYAMSEQVATRMQTDVLTLHTPSLGPAVVPPSGGTAVLETAPHVRLRSKASPGIRRKAKRPRRHLLVRHISGNRVVAVIEVVSPANKDRRSNVTDLAEKVLQLLLADIQVLLIDLLPPGRYDPQGIHGAVWSHFDPAGYQSPPGEPFTLASYRWDASEPEVFVEPVGLSRPLIDMPLFLNSERYVNVRLESTYMETFEGLGEILRQVLEGTKAANGG